MKFLVCGKEEKVYHKKTELTIIFSSRATQQIFMNNRYSVSLNNIH
jgi:hypothetical protein